MTLDEWASVADVVGAIAVVSSLVYLAIQIKLNTVSVRGSAYQTWASNASEQYASAQASPAMSRAIAQGLADPAGLTDENWVQFAFWCHQFVLTAETTYYLHKERVISDSVFDKELERTAALIAAGSGGAQWWRAGARTQFSAEFVKVLEARVGKESDFQRYAFAVGRGFYGAS